MDAQMTASAVGTVGCTAAQPDVGWGCGVKLRPVPALDKQVKFQQRSAWHPRQTQHHSNTLPSQRDPL